jgi:steroid delta-isomerase-like uncharacterized protein
MSTEENKALARRFVAEVMNAGNLEAADQFIAPNLVVHNPVPGQAPGREGCKQTLATLRNAFPDLHFTIEDLLADGDKVMIRSTYRGTHRGELLGFPPTGEPVAVMGIDLLRIADGQIVEHWGTYDQMEMLHQLGVLPSPGGRLLALIPWIQRLLVPVSLAGLGLVVGYALGTWRSTRDARE